MKLNVHVTMLSFPSKCPLGVFVGKGLFLTCLFLPCPSEPCVYSAALLLIFLPFYLAVASVTIVIPCVACSNGFQASLTRIHSKKYTLVCSPAQQTQILSVETKVFKNLYLMFLSVMVKPDQTSPS